MQGLSREFRRRVADDLEMFVNQPFTTPTVLGDIGSLERGRFETSTASTLGAIGIETGQPLQGQPFSIRWLSNRTGSTEVTVKAEGVPPIGGLAEAELGLQFRFGRAGSYYFEAEDAVIRRIAETPQLLQSLSAARKSGTLSRRDRIVTEVLVARRARLLIAETKDAELTLAASAAFKSIVDAGVGFSVRRSRGSVLSVEVDAEEDVVFFMKMIRVRRWGRAMPVRALEFAAPPTAVPASVVADEEAFVVETAHPRDEQDLEEE